MGSASPTGVDNLTDGMGRWSNFLEGDCENTKEENLSTRKVERLRMLGNIGRLEKSSGTVPAQVH